MIYANFTYYREEFHGSLISESNFEYQAARASEYMDSITFGRINEEIMQSDTAAALIKSCCCALAEANLRHDSNSGKSSEKVGEWSVSYSIKSDSEYAAELYRIAERYLANTGLLYRGV